MQRYLEVDQGTESCRRFAAKVRAYLAYLISGNFQQSSGLLSFRVLVVVSSKARLASLQSAVSETMARTVPRLRCGPGAGELVWFALQESIRADTILGDIWVAEGHPVFFVPAGQG
jgi:hypothetical protein